MILDINTIIIAILAIFLVWNSSNLRRPTPRALVYAVSEPLYRLLLLAGILYAVNYNITVGLLLMVIFSLSFQDYLIVSDDMRVRYLSLNNSGLKLSNIARG
jgi:hypothetical protein